MISETKRKRTEIANKAIEIIASHGRKFFSLAAEGRTVEQNRISRFELRDDGRLYFIDKYTQKAIYAHTRKPNNQWRGFSEGGTLYSLIGMMADWILQKRDNFPIAYLGPWPKWVCDGELWGYGDEMEAVRTKIKELLA